MPTNRPKNENTYILDIDNGAEMARLMYQDRLLAQHLGGLFPEQLDLATIHDILDLACGPGGWVLDVASAHPQINVVGIDLDYDMVSYARAQAQVQGLDNAAFDCMNILESLDFPDSSFDLVNARFLQSFMPTTAWSLLLQECLRITRSGGVIQLVECEWPITNKPAHEKMSALFTHAMYEAGHSFCPNGHHLGITSMLGRFLREAKCQNIQQMAYAIDFSTEAKAHEDCFQGLLILVELLKPFLITMGMTTQDEVDRLYQEMLRDMYANDFCGIWFHLIVWGKKP